MNRRHLFKTLLGSAASVVIPFKVDAVVPRFRTRGIVRWMGQAMSEPSLERGHITEFEWERLCRQVFEAIQNDPSDFPTHVMLRDEVIRIL